MYSFSGTLGALALPTQRYELVYFCDGNHDCLLVRSTQMSIPLHILYAFSGILGALALPTQRYELVYFCDGNHGCLLVRSIQMSSAGFLRLAHCFYCACTPQRYYELIIDATKVHTMNIIL